MLRKSMKLTSQFLILTTTMLLAFSSNADNSDAEDRHTKECPSIAIERSDQLFATDIHGVAASDKTLCLSRRNHVKAVLAWNSDNVHPNKNGLQVLNARNLLNDWEQNYAMRNGKDYKAVIVAYGKGARWALSDAAYNKKFGTDNPSTEIVKSLMQRGAKIYMCQNSMKGNQWKLMDLIDGVEMVPAGVSALVDFQYQGYRYIAP
ncbi:MAG: DsrE family protein [Gammaproteobacteria bacterium]|nr:DsrE family protein [Gammaproteobacteria bacterium]